MVDADVIVISPALFYDTATLNTARSRKRHIIMQAN